MDNNKRLILDYLNTLTHNKHDVITEFEKKCSKCKEIKNIKFFQIKRRNIGYKEDGSILYKFYLDSRCNKCNSKESMESMKRKMQSFSDEEKLNFLKRHRVYNRKSKNNSTKKMSDTYLVNLFIGRRRGEIKKDDIRNNKELIEIKKLQLEIHREYIKLKNG